MKYSQAAGHKKKQEEEEDPPPPTPPAVTQSPTHRHDTTAFSVVVVFAVPAFSLSLPLLLRLFFSITFPILLPSSLCYVEPRTWDGIRNEERGLCTYVADIGMLVFLLARSVASSVGLPISRVEGVCSSVRWPG